MAESLEQIERELARLRMNEDGTLAARASVLNLIVVTGEDSSGEVARVISELSGRYPSRAILMISDPHEEEANVEIGLSAFCSVRGGGGNQVCAEQITIHVEGPPAGHLESLAGPLLIPDLPVFLWYPNGDIPYSPDCGGIAALADRLILDSAGGAGDCEASMRGIANLLEGCVLAVGDLQWAALSPWRSLIADLFTPPERAGDLENVRRLEILHGPNGECQALLLAGWLSVALGWHPESLEERTEEGRVFRFSGSSGDVTVELAQHASGTALHRLRLLTGELAFQIQASHRGKHADVCSTVVRGDEPLSERTVYLRSSDPSVLLGEEFEILGRDETYESALERVTEMLSL